MRVIHRTYKQTKENEAIFKAEINRCFQNR